MKNFIRAILFVFLLVPLATIFSACGSTPPKVNSTEITSSGVTLEYKKVEYDGTAKEPTVIVVVGGTTLSAEDYTVEYLDNVEIGTATVVVSAVEGGKYKGTARVSFEITKIIITSEDVSLDYYNVMYTGEAFTPGVVIMHNGLFVSGSEYEVTYKNNVNAGTAVVVIKDKGEGDYSIDVEKTFTIVPQIYDEETWELTIEYESVEYDGTAKTPTVTVVIDGTELELGKDFTLRYLRNVNVGMASVIVTSVEGCNYSFSIMLDFEIILSEN